ncbi:Zn-dependent hydrolase [Aureimonas endophytica]|uniref:Zn-dependent hydrolase n=1 Tax=Aureimonas endophytica TaxID=2027858 RepID=A0A916ZGJ2_9HYPH|nr:MBL fold metallo-hydrolase [Aureimonas endophytica]GGD94446.1 Zn-dependent hydrolase [Aureimonas endophytica]
MPRFRLLLALLALLALSPLAEAQSPPDGAGSGRSQPSTCHAVAEALPTATFVALKREARPRLAAGERRDEVRITFIQHATYLIESPDGVTIATDYTGNAGGIVPRVATMNKAHSTHYTNHPDPGIEHVLRGWNPEGGPARHYLTVGDVLVRNVPSDIRLWGGGMEKDGNSIFVFETAGLCIGHLGHLHEKLTDAQFAEIGRLDIVMVPVDGSWTMSQEGMAAMVARLQSRLVLPMHNFRGRMDRFLAQLPDFAVERRASPSLAVSLRSLPKRPTVVLLEGI